MARDPFLQPFEINPVGGVNTEYNPAAIDDKEVQASQNFLYERGMALTRGGLVAGVTGVPAAGIAWFGYLLIAGQPRLLMISLDGTTVYPVTNGGFGAALTGPAITARATYDSRLINYASVNGAMLVTGLNFTGGGILRWVPGNAAYTQVAANAVNPSYIVGFNSRAVGANDLTANNGQLIVEWSVPGDETTWTGSTNGSGSTTLADAPDGITGIGVISGALVIARYTGFHLGFATGQAFPAFRFNSFSQQERGVGCYFPGTFYVYNNVSYFVGQDNVYSFDGNNITPIGTKIRTKLFNRLVNSKATYRGFVATGNAPAILPAGSSNIYQTVTPRYHLVPIQTPGGASQSNPTYEHFAYDINTGAWSIHSYGPAMGWAGPYASKVSGTIVGPEQFAVIPYGATNTGTTLEWGQVACEQLASFTTKSFVIGSYDRDMKLERVLMSLFNISNAIGTTATLTVQGELGQATVTSLGTLGNINIGPQGIQSGARFRRWVDILGSLGQNISVTLSVQANIGQVATDYIGLMVSELGSFRG